MGKTVALFRAEEEARASAQRLAAQDMGAVVAPVFAPAALDPVSPPGPFDAFLASSAKAIDLAPAALIETIAKLDGFVVGAKTYAAASRRGLSSKPPAPDAATLAADLIARAPPLRLLYLAGRDRKPELERALGAAGFTISICEIYEMRAREAWSDSEAAAVAGADAALHYSRRSAELACRLAERAGIFERWLTIAHVALSADAAKPLQAAGAATAAAAAPNEAALFTALLNL